MASSTCKEYDEMVMYIVRSATYQDPEIKLPLADDYLKKKRELWVKIKNRMIDDDILTVNEYEGDSPVRVSLHPDTVIEEYPDRRGACPWIQNFFRQGRIDSTIATCMKQVTEHIDTYQGPYVPYPLSAPKVFLAVRCKQYLDLINLIVKQALVYAYPQTIQEKTILAAVSFHSRPWRQRLVERSLHRMIKDSILIPICKDPGGRTYKLCTLFEPKRFYERRESDWINATAEDSHASWIDLREFLNSSVESFTQAQLIELFGPVSGTRYDTLQDEFRVKIKTETISDEDMRSILPEGKSRGQVKRKGQPIHDSPPRKSTKIASNSPNPIPEALCDAGYSTNRAKIGNSSAAVAQPVSRTIPDLTTRFETLQHVSKNPIPAPVISNSMPNLAIEFESLAYGPPARPRQFQPPAINAPRRRRKATPLPRANPSSLHALPPARMTGYSVPGYGPHGYPGISSTGSGVSTAKSMVDEGPASRELADGHLQSALAVNKLQPGSGPDKFQELPPSTTSASSSGDASNRSSMQGFPGERPVSSKSRVTKLTSTQGFQSEVMEPTVPGIVLPENTAPQALPGQPTAAPQALTDPENSPFSLHTSSTPFPSLYNLPAIAAWFADPHQSGLLLWKDAKNHESITWKALISLLQGPTGLTLVSIHTSMNQACDSILDPSQTASRVTKEKRYEIGAFAFPLVWNKMGVPWKEDENMKRWLLVALQFYASTAVKRWKLDLTQKKRKEREALAEQSVSGPSQPASVPVPNQPAPAILVPKTEIEDEERPARVLRKKRTLAWLKPGVPEAGPSVEKPIKKESTYSKKSQAPRAAKKQIRKLKEESEDDSAANRTVTGTDARVAPVAAKEGEDTIVV